MAQRTSHAEPSPQARRILVLAVLGVSALFVGALALWSEPQGGPPASAHRGTEWTEVVDRLQIVVDDARSSLEDLDEAAEEATRRAPPGGGRRREGAGFASKVAHGRAGRRTADAASRLRELSELEGFEHVARDLDPAKLSTLFDTYTVDLASAPADPERWMEIAAGLREQLPILEGALEEVREEAEADEDGVVDGTETEDGGETETLRRNVLAATLTFVFLNFGLLFLQTLRAKPVPKVVQDAFTASASFLIGAGTSFWMG